MNINLKYLLRGTVATLLTMTLLQSCKKHETLSTNEPAQTMSGITASLCKQTNDKYKFSWNCRSIKIFQLESVLSSCVHFK